MVGGVNIQLLEIWSDAFTRAGMLSPDNRCKFGDNGANGYVRGEGCGGIVIRKLAEVAQDGDPVYALVIGSAVNQVRFMCTSTYYTTHVHIVEVGWMRYLRTIPHILGYVRLKLCIE